MIEVSHLTKRYGEVLALDDVSFSVETGAICGLLGPNGAGKSTTMNIMTGCLAATEGEVRYDGLEIYADMNAVKKTIGYLPEQPPLYLDMTVREYLEFVARAKGIPHKEVEAAALTVSASCGVAGVQHRLIKHLSKGYKQRVGIAQALLGNPDTIILDEPTVGLDPIQIIEIRALIRQLAQHHTVIISSHILSEIRALCDQIVIISKGKLVADDTPEGLETQLAGSRTTTLILRADAQHSLDALASVPHIAEITQHPLASKDASEGCVQFVVTAEGACDIRDDLFRACVAADLHVLEMSTKHASLEDVFIELTEHDAEFEEDIAREASEENDASSDIGAPVGAPAPGAPAKTAPRAAAAAPGSLDTADAAPSAPGAASAEPAPSTPTAAGSASAEAASDPRKEG